MGKIGDRQHVDYSQESSRRKTEQEEHHIRKKITEEIQDGRKK